MRFENVLLDKFLHIADYLGPTPALGIARARNGVSPNSWFVDCQQGYASADGRDPRRPALTMNAIIGSTPKARSGDTIFVVGNIREEVTSSNLLEDITIIGVGNRPRHADKARDYATYPTYRGISGCSWREASSHTASTPLLKIRGQGWRIENILFAPPSDAAALQLERNALSDISEYDASHFAVEGCRFAGGQDGIADSGGCFNVNIKGCIFHAQTGISIKGLNTAVAVPSGWDIDGNHFYNSAQHIVMSLSYGQVRHNVLGRRTSTYGINLIALSAQGDYNSVFGNTLAGDYDGGYLGGTNDNWAGNYSMDVSSGEVGAEGLTTAAPVA